MSTLRVALVGNPNCGKTALFNQLTGSRQKVANYAGVTVERKEGRMHRAVRPHHRRCSTCRAPTASMPPAPMKRSPATSATASSRAKPAPDLLVCVVDATNLRLHLRFVLEVRRLGRPMVLALNMMDAAKRRGIRHRCPKLAARLGMPVVETVAVQRDGTEALVEQLDRAHAAGAGPVRLRRRRPARRTCARSSPKPWSACRARTADDRRRARPLAAASGVRPAVAGGGDVPDLPGGVCLGRRR